MLPASKDYLLKGTENPEKNNISFNIVAHSGLITKHSQDIATTGYSLFDLLCCYWFSYHTHFLFQHALGIQSALPFPTALRTNVAHFLARAKRNVSCVQMFAYLFRLTCWMLLKTHLHVL